MGIVARPNREPDTLLGLACPERILLYGVRTWVAAYKRGDCGLYHLALTYRRFDVPAATPRMRGVRAPRSLTWTSWGPAGRPRMRNRPSGSMSATRSTPIQWTAIPPDGWASGS